MLVIAGQNKHIKLLAPKKDLYWKETHNKSIEDIEQTGCEVSGIAWSPHGPYLALCGKKWEHIYVLNYRSLSDVTQRKIKIPNGRFQNCCSFDKSGHVLATVGVSGVVFIWKLNQVTGDWDQINELPNFTLTTVTTLSWEPTASYLCTGDTKGHVTVHVRDDIKSYNFTNKIDLCNGRTEEITALVCNPYFPYQPEEISVGYSNGFLDVWDIKTKWVTFSLQSHKTMITDIAYSTINGMLLVTASLDGELHLISLKSGLVIKKLVVSKPVYSVDFIRGKQELVYITDTELVTYNLREAWVSRKADPQLHCRFVRYQTSRDPLEETQTAYLTRAPASVRYEMSQEEVKTVVKNKPQFDPHKPSPPCKGLTREQISAQFASATSSPLPSVQPTSVQPTSSPAASVQPTETQHNEPPHNDPQRNIPNISDIEEEAGSFNISDIANYTDRGDEDRACYVAASVLQKRSADGLLKANVFSPEGNESTVEIADCPNKVRRVEKVDKENQPPKVDTPLPKENFSTKQPRFVSSTPAVTSTSTSKQPRFGTPTSSTTNVLGTRSRTPQSSGTPRVTMTPTSSNTAAAAASLLRRTPTAVPTKGRKEGSISEDYSPFSLISSLETDHNLSVADLSHKLRAMGNKDMGSKMSTSGSNLLQVPNISPAVSSGQGSGISNNILTPNTLNTDCTRNTGVLMSGDQMELIQKMLTEGFKDLKKELNSEARWLKNEVVKNTLATEWNLEDILKTIVERQERFEQRMSNMEQDIAAIKNNI